MRQGGHWGLLANTLGTGSYSLSRGNKVESKEQDSLFSWYGIYFLWYLLMCRTHSSESTHTYICAYVHTYMNFTHKHTYEIKINNDKISITYVEMLSCEARETM